MGDDTGLIPRAVTAEPCVYCGSSGHFSGNCPYPHTAPESRRSKTELRRVSVRAHDTEMHCDVRRPGWWSWLCSKHGWGPGYGTRAAALAGKRAHEAEHR